MSLTKTFLQSIIFSLVNISLNFGFKIYLAKIISKEDLAIYFTAIDIFSLALLILVGFRSSMVVSYSKTKDDLKILNLFRYFLIATMLLSWAFIIPYIKHKVGVDINYWYLVSLILAMGTYTYLTNQLAMYRLYKNINQIIFLEPIFVISWFAIAYYLAHTNDIKSLFISGIMSSISLSIYIYIKKRNSIKEPTFSLVPLNPQMKSFLKNSIISTIEFASGMFILYLAVIFIIKYFSHNELGDFQVVVKPIFMYLITLFVFPIFRFILPELSFLVAKKDILKILQIKKWIYIFSGFVSFIFVVVSLNYSKEIIATLFPQQYQHSYLMLTHLSFFFIFIMLNAYQIAFIKASGEFFKALLIRVSGVAGFLIAFFTIRYFSDNIISIIIALASSYTVMFAFSFIVENQILKKLKE